MTKFNPLPTQARLHELLDYDPDTGEFHWKVRTAKQIKVGQVAGCLNKIDGYYVIMVDGILYKSHRLAWMYIYGKDPGNLQIDHANKNRADNRIANLRLATYTQNKWNTNALGVYWNKRARKWVAQIQVDKARKYLGSFRYYWSAIHAYQQARLHYFGKFA